MDAIIAVNICVTGFMIGFVFSDLKDRQRINKKLKEELGSLRELCAVINDSHNKLVEANKKTSERLVAFEMNAMRK